MPSDAAKKKAAQKRVAAANKRVPAGKKDADGPPDEELPIFDKNDGASSERRDLARTSQSVGSTGVGDGEGRAEKARDIRGSNAAEAHVTRVVFPTTLSARQRALIHGKT